MKLTKSTYSMAAGLVLLLTGCSEYTPNGYTEGPILPTVSSISYSQIGASNKNISISWTLPSDKDMTGCSLYCDGTEIQTFGINSDLNYSYDVYGVPLGREVVYTVKVKYTDNRLSTGKSIVINLPADTSTKIRLYLLPDDAPTAADLSDDDEKAAAAWFAQQPDVKFIHPSEIANCDPKTYSVMWIEIDRVGLPHGWENLPGNIAAESTITALRQYLANGGNLYLSNMATQLTVPLGIVPDNMAPTVFGNGEGGSGDDVWVINPYLGWDFRNGSDQGFYDRTLHEIYKGLTLEDPNNYGYANLPLIGPGHREDHNCMWDCNLYGRGDQRDVIKNFEVTTNSLVLATWGHVRDHCVAGLVDFNPNAEHGRCVAMGLAAYEWNQNSGTNPYQHNVEQLTKNILDYLK